MYKKRSYILARIIGVLLLLVLAALLALQSPRAQTWISGKVAQKLEDSFDGKVTFSRLQVLPVNSVLLHDVLVMDDAPFLEGADTLAYAKSISANFSIAGLFRNEGLHIRNLYLDDVMVHLVVEPCTDPGHKSRTNLQRVFRLPWPEKKNEEGPDVFDISKLKGTGLRYRMTSCLENKPEYSGFGIDYNDLDLTANLVARNVRFSKSRMHATVESLDFTEKCGYALDKLSGSCIVGMGKTLISDLHLQDAWSDANVDSFTMSYYSGLSFQHFTDEVELDLRLGEGTLSAQTLAYLSGAAIPLWPTLDIKGGRASGYVKDLDIDRLAFTETVSGISADLGLAVAGLPDISKSRLDLDLKELNFTTGQLEKVLSISGISKYYPGETLTASGKSSGTLNNLTADLALQGGQERVTLQGNVLNAASTTSPIQFQAEAGAHNLNIGHILDTDKLGTVTFRTGATATLQKGDPSILVDSLIITRLEALGHAYTGIKAAGSLENGNLKATLGSADPALKMLAQAECELAGEEGQARYRLAASIVEADLQALNLYTDKGKALATAKIDADLTRTDDGSLVTDISIPQLVFTNDDGDHDLGEIDLMGSLAEGRNLLSLNAPFANITFSGSKDPIKFIEDFQNLTLRKDIPAIFGKRTSEAPCGSYDINAEFHDTRDILSIIGPGLYLADSTRAVVGIDGKGALQGSVSTKRLAYGTNYVKDADIALDNMGSGLNLMLTGSEVKAAGIALKDASVSAAAREDAFSLACRYDNSGERENAAELRFDGEFARNSSDSLVITARPVDSYIILDDEYWELGDSRISYCAGDISIDNFRLSSEGQSFSMDGGFSPTREDRLAANISNLDLSIIDRFLPKELGIGGTASGDLRLTSPPGGRLPMLLTMTCDDVRIGDADAGVVKLASSWDEEKSRLNLFLHDFVDGTPTLRVRGWYDPAEKEMGADADLDSFDLGILAPLLSDVFSSSGGKVRGEVSVNGTKDRLDISSKDVALDDAMFGIAFTGAKYWLDGPLRIDNKGVFFDSVSVRDDADGRGSLKGALRYDRLKDMSMDAALTMDKLKVVDLPEGSGNGFYGHLAARGNASVRGPFEALVIDADVSTSGDGDLHIPLNSASIGTTSDLLTFVEPQRYIDPFEQHLLEQSGTKARKSGDIIAKARVRANKGVKAFVEIDKSTGNVMSIDGEGSVSLDIRPSKAIFNANGEYSIAEGNYHFVIPGLLERDFGIVEGSSIKFGGDLLDTEVNVNANYNLKTSLATLLSDTTAVSSRRPVECGLAITDKLRNPQLGFSINVPDLDPTTKSLVESALNTEDKVQKQFVALLLFGTFFPSEQSGIVNGGNMLYSNVTEVMSSQLNSILQKLEIPLDLGLGYQQNQNGTDIFDVAVSTQLFNNKVLVNGSVGNRQYSTSTNPRGDVVGDLDIEIKLDKPGQFRLNLFSHSADEYTSFLDYSQRNGVGLSYQREYNRLVGLLRSMFGKLQDQMPRERPREREMVTINVKADE